MLWPIHFAALLLADWKSALGTGHLIFKGGKVVKFWRKKNSKSPGVRKKSCSIQLRKKNPAKRGLKQNNFNSSKKCLAQFFYEEKYLAFSPGRKEILHSLNLPAPPPNPLKSEMVHPLVNFLSFRIWMAKIVVQCMKGFRICCINVLFYFKTLTNQRENLGK